MRFFSGTPCIYTIHTSGKRESRGLACLIRSAIALSTIQSLTYSCCAVLMKFTHAFDRFIRLSCYCKRCVRACTVDAHHVTCCLATVLRRRRRRRGDEFTQRSTSHSIRLTLAPPAYIKLQHRHRHNATNDTHPKCSFQASLFDKLLHTSPAADVPVHCRKLLSRDRK